MSLLDSHPIPKRWPGEDRREWRKRVEDSRPGPAQAAESEGRLFLVCDGLLEATIPAEYRTHRSYAIDWTHVFTWAARRKADLLSDPTSSYGRHSRVSPGDDKDDRYVGFSEQVVSLVKEDMNGAQEAEPVPELVRRVILSEAKAHEAPLILPVLERMIADTGIKPGDLLADAAYPHASGWTLAVRQQGWSPVVDIHPFDLGLKGTQKGAIDADGQMLCPNTPQGLLTVLKSPSPHATDEVDATLEERNSYAFQSKGRPDKDAYQRMSCPAAVGKVRCPFVPESLNANPTKPIIDPSGQQGKPPCCDHKSTTFSNEANAKTRQKHPYRTEAWRDSYRRRSAVERSFAFAKDSDWAGLHRGSIKMRGRAKHMLLRAFAYAYQNLRRLDSFISRMADEAKKEAAKKAQPKKRKSRRKSPTPGAAGPQVVAHQAAAPT